MISLIKLAQEGKIETTGAKPKLPIKVDGVSSETLDVYKIPLKYLYYNDQNGRITTGIAEYGEEIHPAYDNENPEYNETIAKIIENGRASDLKRTQKSIEESGQQVYGWVLDDGSYGQTVDFLEEFRVFEVLQFNHKIHFSSFPSSAHLRSLRISCITRCVCVR